MTNRAIPELPAARELTGEEMIPIWQDGQTRWIRLSALGTGTGGGGTGTTAAWRGARTRIAANILNPGYPYVIPWSSADRDTDNLWSPDAPTRFTVPTGTGLVRLSASIQLNSRAVAGSLFLRINRNGAEAHGLPIQHVRQGSTGYLENIVTLTSGPVDATGGDFFEARLSVNMSNVVDILASERTWFAIELLEAA